jgi:hypothetical protein
MLSIAGHVFAEKRRKLSARTFSDLVVVKLKLKPLNKSYFNHETITNYYLLELVLFIRKVIIEVENF